MDSALIQAPTLLLACSGLAIPCWFRGIVYVLFVLSVVTILQQKLQQVPPQLSDQLLEPAGDKSP